MWAVGWVWASRARGFRGWLGKAGGLRQLGFRVLVGVKGLAVWQPAELEE